MLLLSTAFVSSQDQDMLSAVALLYHLALMPCAFCLLRRDSFHNPFLYYISPAPTPERPLSTSLMQSLRLITGKFLGPRSTLLSGCYCEQKRKPVLWPLATPPKAVTHSPAQPFSPTSLLVSARIALSSLVNISIMPPAARSASAAFNPTSGLAFLSMVPMVTSSSKASSSFLTALQTLAWGLPPSQYRWLSLVINSQWVIRDHLIAVCMDVDIFMSHLG